jgi:hypothetical protein
MPGNCYCTYGNSVERDPSQTCSCMLPNVGTDCSTGRSCHAGSKCTALSEVIQEGFATGTEPRFFEEEIQQDGSKVRRAKPTSWFGDEKVPFCVFLHTMMLTTLRSSRLSHFGPAHPTLSALCFGSATTLKKRFSSGNCYMQKLMHTGTDLTL